MQLVSYFTIIWIVFLSQGDADICLQLSNCSCSLKCSIFNNCCSGALEQSQVHFKEYRLDIDIAKWLVKEITPQCLKPGNVKLADPPKVKFDNNISPITIAPQCSKDEYSDAFKRGNILLADLWPVIETRTGIVFRNVAEARCVGKKLQGTMKATATRNAEIEFWSSYQVSCKLANGLHIPYDDSLDPFDQLSSERLVYRYNGSCSVTLMDLNVDQEKKVMFCPRSTEGIISHDVQKRNDSLRSSIVTNENRSTTQKSRYLMSFRMLMDFKANSGESVQDLQPEEAGGKFIIYRFIVLGFLTLSIASLTVMLTIYSLFKQLRNLPGKLTMCLASALLIALLCYAIGVLAVPKIWYVSKD